MNEDNGEIVEIDVEQEIFIQLAIPGFNEVTDSISNIH